MTFKENDYSNRTVYGIESDALRYTWAGYLIFVLASSLIGDTTILIASIKYRAFKLHKVMILIIQHIAVCDLMVSLTDVLPKLVSIMAGNWVFGKFLCNATPYLRYYFNLASLLLICNMTTSKMLLLKYPLRFGSITSRKARIFPLACWLVAGVFPLIFLVLDWNDVSFSYRGYQCNYGYSSDIYHWLKPILAILFIFIPNCLVVATTISVLIIAKQAVRRSRGSLKMQGIVTTVLTAMFYCLSVLPLVVYRVGESFIDKTSSSVFHIQFYRVTISCIFINTISNFYIYSLTVSSFREFILTGIKQSTLLFNNPGFSIGEKTVNSSNCKLVFCLISIISTYQIVLTAAN